VSDGLWLAPEVDERSAQRLLLADPPDPDGRVAIYVCPECADIYCGAITAVIEKEGEKTVWRDVAHSNPNWWGRRRDRGVASRARGIDRGLGVAHGAVQRGDRESPSNQ